MSNSERQGNRTYRRGAASTARSTTSIDTGVLLQRADDAALDTARSNVSVDTDVLLGDLASARDLDEPGPVSGTQGPLNLTYTNSTHLSSSDESKLPWNHTNSGSLALQSNLSVDSEEPFNSAYTQSMSLPSSIVGSKVPMNSDYTRQASPTADDLISSPVISSKSPFHADELSRRHLDHSLGTARSVASADCAPVEYDEDVLHGDADHLRSSGFEVCALDKRHVSKDCPSTANNSHGSSVFQTSLLDKLDEGSRRANVLSNGSSGFETPVLEQRRLSETDDGLCSVTARSDSSLDAAMLLRDSTFSPAVTDDVPALNSGTTSRTVASVDTNVLLQTTEDVVMAMEAARTNHLDRISSRDHSPSARNDISDFYQDVDRNPYIIEDDNHLDADYETETVDIMGKTHEVPAHSSVSKPPVADRTLYNDSAVRNSRRATKEAWGNSSDYDFPANVGPSRQRSSAQVKTAQLSQKRATVDDFDARREYLGRSYTAPRSEFDRRRYGAPTRTHSGTRTYPGQDSDRSLTSSASLGAQIVAKSRQNLRPASGKGHKTSGSATRKVTEQRDRDLSPSGLVLEGCRVPLRPSTGGPHDRTESRAVTRGSSRTAGRSSLTAGGSRVQQNGRSESRTSPARGVGGTTGPKGWTDDTSALNDSLNVDGERRSATDAQQVCNVRRISMLVIDQSL